jgi:hypothetical protein
MIMISSTNSDVSEFTRNEKGELEFTMCGKKYTVPRHEGVDETIIARAIIAKAVYETSRDRKRD